MISLHYDYIEINANIDLKNREMYSKIQHSNYSETHANIERLMQEFSCDFFKFLIGDNKILRQGYGMQTCSSKFGCVWCHASSPYNFDENFTLRTFKSLRENYELFQQLVEKYGFETAKALYAPQCKSVIRKNLVAGLDHERVIDRSPVGQLHVFICETARRNGIDCKLMWLTLSEP